MNFCQTAKCICFKWQNTGYSKSIISNLAIGLILTNAFVYSVFLSNCKMYLFQIAKCICSKLQNILVSSLKILCPKLPNCAALNICVVFSTVRSILYEYLVFIQIGK